MIEPALANLASLFGDLLAAHRLPAGAVRTDATPRRLVLRPCGAASLFCRQQADGRPRARLLVELLVDEADLTVIIDRKVIFLRTARLPGDHRDIRPLAPHL